MTIAAHAPIRDEDLARRLRSTSAGEPAWLSENAITLDVTIPASSAITDALRLLLTQARADHVEVALIDEDRIHVQFDQASGSDKLWTVDTDRALRRPQRPDARRRPPQQTLTLTGAQLLAARVILRGRTGQLSTDPAHPARCLAHVAATAGPTLLRISPDGVVTELTD